MSLCIYVVQIKLQICHFVPMKIGKFHKHHYPGHKSKIRYECKYFMFSRHMQIENNSSNSGAKTLLHGVIFSKWIKISFFHTRTSLITLLSKAFNIAYPSVRSYFTREINKYFVALYMWYMNSLTTLPSKSFPERFHPSIRMVYLLTLLTGTFSTPYKRKQEVCTMCIVYLLSFIFILLKESSLVTTYGPCSYFCI